MPLDAAWESLVCDMVVFAATVFQIEYELKHGETLPSAQQNFSMQIQQRRTWILYMSIYMHMCAYTFVSHVFVSLYYVHVYANV